MNIVQGKTYDTRDEIGANLWLDIQARVGSQETVLDVDEDRSRYGAEYLTRARLGQGAFRVLVTEAYDKRCAITGERTLPVLQASHIKPFKRSGPNRISNGLLLRSDLHLLFDAGYLTVTPNLDVEVSNRIKEEFKNGREYYAHHGKRLAIVPPNFIERPSAEFLKWHNENCFEKDASRDG
jgi:putative restriction endonuclease